MRLTVVRPLPTIAPTVLHRPTPFSIPGSTVAHYHHHPNMQMEISNRSPQSPKPETQNPRPATRDRRRSLRIRDGPRPRSRHSHDHYRRVTPRTALPGHVCEHRTAPSDGAGQCLGITNVSLNSCAADTRERALCKVSRSTVLPSVQTRACCCRHTCSSTFRGMMRLSYSHGQ